MPRIRTVKPEFHSDEKVMSVSRDARLLFVGMLNFADDNGAMVNSPRELKARIFPGDDDTDVPGWLTQLIEVGLVVAYEVEGRFYLQVKNLTKHQVIDKARKTSLPPPPEINGNQLKSIDVNGNQLKSIENSPGREGKGKERKREKGEKIAAAKSAACSLDFCWHDFEKLRGGWPRQDGEAEARKAWEALVRKKLLPPLGIILTALEKQKLSQQWADPVFVPKLARWLRERRWGDVLPEAKEAGRGGEAGKRGNGEVGGHCPHDLRPKECPICRDHLGAKAAVTGRGP